MKTIIRKSAITSGSITSTMMIYSVIDKIVLGDILLAGICGFGLGVIPGVFVSGITCMLLEEEELTIKKNINLYGIGCGIAGAGLSIVCIAQ